jgi:hypothetical protein
LTLDLSFHKHLKPGQSPIFSFCYFAGKPQTDNQISAPITTSVAAPLQQSLQIQQIKQSPEAATQRARPAPYDKYFTPPSSMKNEDLQAELDTLVATQAGLMAIVGSLMATHPHYDQFQLHLTGLLEVLLTGDAGKTFTENQRQQARDFVQTLQNINKAPSKIEPLSSVPNL